MEYLSNLIRAGLTANKSCPLMSRDLAQLSCDTFELEEAQAFKPQLDILTSH